MGCTLRSGVVSVFTLLLLAPGAPVGSTADPPPPEPASEPKATAATLFTDGFETGNTSRWSNGDGGEDCATTLVMPTSLAGGGAT